jgi:hypothetical protein
MGLPYTVSTSRPLSRVKDMVSFPFTLFAFELGVIELFFILYIKDLGVQIW